jgi:hypothetical protein
MHDVRAAPSGSRLRWAAYVLCPRPDVDPGYAPAFTHDVLIAQPEPNA